MELSLLFFSLFLLSLSELKTILQKPRLIAHPFLLLFSLREAQEREKRVRYKKVKTSHEIFDEWLEKDTRRS